MISRRKKIIAITLLAILSLAIFSFVFFMAELDYSKNEKSKMRDNLYSNEEKIVNVHKEIIASEINKVFSDLLFLKKQVESSIDKESMSIDTNALAEYMKNLSRSKKVYFTISYIDRKGNEIVKIVNQNSDNNVKRDFEMKRVSNRYFFQDVFRMGKDEIYISKMDLENIKGSEMDEYKTILKFGTKIYTPTGEASGIILVDYNAEEFIRNFDRSSFLSQGKTYLLNSDGYFLRNSSDLSSEFAFVKEEKTTNNFKNIYKNAWEAVKKGKSIYIEKNQAFFFSELIPFTNEDNRFIIDLNKIVLGEGNWVAVSHIDIKDNPQFFDGDFWTSILSILKKSYTVFISFAILVVVLAISVFNIFENRKKIKYFSELDQMTNVFNRRTGIQKLKSIIELIKRTKNSITICYIDIDGTKTINEKLSHREGDDLIKTVAGVLKTKLRCSDFVIRYQGDKFVVGLYNSTLEQADNVWSRILDKFEQINTFEDRLYRISVSHGFVEINTDKNIKEPKYYIDIADSRMLDEKKAKKGKLDLLREKEETE